MPLFYHFEYNDIFAKAYVVTNQWGLVDTLEGAIAALATSSLRFGIVWPCSLAGIWQRLYEPRSDSTGSKSHCHNDLGIRCLLVDISGRSTTSISVPIFPNDHCLVRTGNLPTPP